MWISGVNDIIETVSEGDPNRSKREGDGLDQTHLWVSAVVDLQTVVGQKYDIRMLESDVQNMFALPDIDCTFHPRHSSGGLNSYR